RREPPAGCSRVRARLLPRLQSADDPGRTAHPWDGRVRQPLHQQWPWAYGVHHGLRLQPNRGRPDQRSENGDPRRRPDADIPPLSPGRMMVTAMRLYRDPDVPGRLDFDRSFYRRIAEATDRRRLVHDHTVPIRSGYAWPLPAGGLVRIVAIEGPQVCDLNLWNLNNPRERFWAARTRQLQGAHVTTFDRLWSCLPYLRPMITIP